MGETIRTTSETAALQGNSRPSVADIVAGIALVLVLGALTRFFDTHVPQWAADTPFKRVAKTVEYPVYAIVIGLIGNVVLNKLGLRERLSAGFRTEFFIKTGVVLLGASINLKILVTAAAPSIVQALALITIVFGFTWWFGGVLGLDDKLRALLSSAVSICGVSAAI
ncbi:putative sulfate exporter family transporter, partial [Nocardia salmonicida]